MSGGGLTCNIGADRPAVKSHMASEQPALPLAGEQA